MTDTTTCENCQADVPTAAKFCTTCGHPMAAAAPPSDPAPAGGPDPTRVDTPAVHDSTQVLPTAGPPDVGTASAPASSAPWSPAAPSTSTDPAPPAWGGSAPPQPTAPPAWAPPPTEQAPQPAHPQAWGPPPTETPPAWQQPPATAPPGGAGPGWGAQPGGPPPSWAPPAQSGPGVWGAPATTSSTAKGSPIGGGVALIGGVVALIGLFTTWVTGDVADASGWDLTKSSGQLTSKDPYFLLVLALAAIVLGVVLFTGAFRPVARIAVIVVGLAIVGLHIRDWTSITHVVETNAAFLNQSVDAGFGFYLGIAGGVVAAAAALLPSAKS